MKEDRKDKENLPNNMQSEKMTYREFKQKQNGGSASKTEHFKNLILSTDTDVATCGKLVVDRVIESIYSQEIGRVEKKPEFSANRSSVPAITPVSSTITLHQSVTSNPNGVKPGDRLGGLFKKATTATTHAPAQRHSGPLPPKPDVPEFSTSGKMNLTFGEIQEKLIRRAVENSYEFDKAFMQKEEAPKRDYSVFDFPSSDVGQNLVEMSRFESRINNKKLDSSSGRIPYSSSASTGRGSYTPVKPASAAASVSFPAQIVNSSANRSNATTTGTGSAGSGHMTQTSHVIGSRPPDGHPPQYVNITAMELLQKCDELARRDPNPAVSSWQGAKMTPTKPPGGSSFVSTNQSSGTTARAPPELKKSPPVPLKKRKILLPVETSPPEEPKPVAPKKR